MRERCLFASASTKAGGRVGLQLVLEEAGNVYATKDLGLDPLCSFSLARQGPITIRPNSAGRCRTAIRSIRSARTTEFRSAAIAAWLSCTGCLRTVKRIPGSAGISSTKLSAAARLSATASAAVRLRPSRIAAASLRTGAAIYIYAVGSIPVSFRPARLLRPRSNRQLITAARTIYLDQ